MPSLAEATLTEVERRVLERFVELLRNELGERLVAVWLFGSRARGERPHPDSDVDLMVLLRSDRDRFVARVYELLQEATHQEGTNLAWYSLVVQDLDWLGRRREIRSFFIQEVDRDKLVLHGSALE